ncbi:hypothetical protein VDGD_20431 [Verticillium dahliae]|nr:hypothetical protein VDGD_20431 [Verticillium dahliae]
MATGWWFAVPIRVQTRYTPGGSPPVTTACSKPWPFPASSMPLKKANSLGSGGVVESNEPMDWTVTWQWPMMSPRLSRSWGAE